MKRKSVMRTVALVLCICIIVAPLNGCAWLSNEMKDIKGELIGNHFTIDFYDNFGGKVVLF